MPKAGSIPKNLPRLERIFEEGFRLKAEPGYKYEQPNRDHEWHDEPAPCPDGLVRFHWHASALAGCPRAQVLKRAGFISEGHPLDSEITFEFGHAVHRLLEEFTQATVEGVSLPEIAFGGRILHVGAETGGCLHPVQELALKARADWVFALDGLGVIHDLKTEGTSLYRLADAKSRDAKDSVKDEHKIQITCNAITQEGLGLVPDKVQLGAVTYCSRKAGLSQDGKPYSKNEWVWDTQWFEITEELRENVYRRLLALDQAWKDFENEGELPNRLPMQKFFGRDTLHWMCRPRGKDDDRGKSCQFRKSCASLAPLEKWS